MSNFNLNTQNLKVNNEVETTVSNNSNCKEMKKINFTVNPAYEQTENENMVNAKVVNEIADAFLRLPSEVRINIIQRNNVLVIKVGMIFQNRIYRAWETPAEIDLIESIMQACVGNPGAVKAYNAEGKEAETGENVKMELFKQFIASPYRASIGKDYETIRNSYKQVSFHFGFKKVIYFCMKESDEVNNLINQACGESLEEKIA